MVRRRPWPVHEALSAVRAVRPDLADLVLASGPTVVAAIVVGKAALNPGPVGRARRQRAGVRAEPLTWRRGRRWLGRRFTRRGGVGRRLRRLRGRGTGRRARLRAGRRTGRPRQADARVVTTWRYWWRARRWRRARRGRRRRRRWWQRRRVWRRRRGHRDRRPPPRWPQDGGRVADRRSGQVVCQTFQSVVPHQGLVGKPFGPDVPEGGIPHAHDRDVGCDIDRVDRIDRIERPKSRAWRGRRVCNVVPFAYRLLCEHEVLPVGTSSVYFVPFSVVRFVEFGKSQVGLLQV